MARLNLHAMKRAYPLPAIVGGLTKLLPAAGGFKARCPLHDERSPSFTMFVGQDGTWRFHCFGCGEQGDALDFIQKRHGVSLREAASILAGGNLPTINVAPIQPISNDDKIRKAGLIWRNAHPVQGTPAEIYLRSRGIDLRIPDSLRYAELRYLNERFLRPCLVACIAGNDRSFFGIQRTYLAADGLSKADVPDAKLSLGRVRGGAIRLAPVAAELVVCEGLEDGLTLQQEMGRAVWVAAGSSMLPAMQFPSLVDKVHIGGDGDEPGRRAAAAAQAAIAGRGLDAQTFFPTAPYKDFNDELRGVRA